MIRTPLEGHLEHHRGRQQRVEKEPSSITPIVFQPSQADQEVSSAVQNNPVETSQLAKQSRVVGSNLG